MSNVAKGKTFKVYLIGKTMAEIEHKTNTELIASTCFLF